MKRKVVSLLILSLPVLVAAIMLCLPVAGQSTPAESAAGPLPQPQQIIIRQQIPLSFTVAAPAGVIDSTSPTATGNLLGALVNSITRSTAVTPTAQTVVVTLTLDLQLTVTDTLTTTVPSTVTLTLADESVTVPVSVTVGAAPQAEVTITLLAPVASEATITATEEITPSTAVSITDETVITTTDTITTPAVTPTVAITGTLAITANLRSGPDTTFDAVSTATAGQQVIVVAQNADATWYLLNNGLWIAASLVSDLQSQPPLATEELVTALRAQPVLTPTTPVTTTTAVTATAPATTTTTATATTTSTGTGPSLILVPTPAASTPPTQTAQAPRVTVDANLRAGPGITFTLLGGTVTGQEINIVARNADGSWFLLDNGGWVSAALVANPPIDIPLYTEDAQNTAVPAATATPLPTPTAALTNTAPVLGVRENLYVIRVDGIVDGYDFTLKKIDELINQADGDVALLKDRAWIVEMTTAITLLRSTSDEVKALSAPTLFSDAHAILQDAATAFTDAADLLAEGVDQLDTERLDQAFARITTGSNLLTRAQAAVEAATP